MDREPGSGLMADGSWRVELRHRFDRHHRIVGGVPQFGFHTGGRLFAVEYAAGWIALIEHGAVVWTAGPTDPGLALVHVEAPFEQPRFVDATAANAVLVCDARGVHRIDLPSVQVAPVVDARDLAVTEPGNCVRAPDGHLWINDIVGHQVLELTGDGRLIRRLGDGSAGFQTGTVGFDDVRFGWIYDLRCGPDGRLYVLDSTSYAVRVIDPAHRTVTTICGDGQPGDRGDGGPAVAARLGGDQSADFDGPWSLVVDARGDVYIGDTHNHAVRRIDATSGLITTIASAGCPGPRGVAAGGPTADGTGSARHDRPLFTKICGLDHDPATDRLLVPDWVDDDVDELVVLTRTG